MIDIIFTLLNFSIFVALVYVYSKKNLLGTITQKIREKKASHNNLLYQQAAGKVEHRSLQEQFEYQERLYYSLDHKVSLWQEAVQADNKALKHKQEAYRKAINERAEKQLAYAECYQVGKHLLPNLLPKIKHTLVSSFEDKKKQEDYLSKTLDLLGESP